MVKVAKSVLSWCYMQLIKHERRQLLRRKFEQLSDPTFIERAVAGDR